MTPTEQDKELQELVDKFIYDIAVLRPYTRVTKEAKRRLVQLITADRKRVALEARLDELEHIKILHKKEVYTTKSGDDVNIRERIAELKAQQEEL